MNSQHVGYSELWDRRAELKELLRKTKEEKTKMDVESNINSGVYENKAFFAPSDEQLAAVQLPDNFGPVQTLEQLDKARKKLTELQDDLRKEFRKNYWGEEQRRLEQFWNDVADELNADQYDSVKWKKARDMAWSNGHSEGLSSVYYWICELADLL